MIGYNPSHLNKNETLLEAFHRVEAYLKANPQYQVYQSSAPYQESTDEYTLNSIIVPEGSKVSVGDVVFFSNSYYAVIAAVYELTFSVETAVSFRGPQGPKGDKGDRGTGGAGSNPNLLINPNFAINQRGQESYTGAQQRVYCVDRWSLQYSSTFETSTKKVSLIAQYSSLRQSIENYKDLIGKTVTFSISVANVSGNDLYMNTTESQSVKITTDGVYTVTVTPSTSITEFKCGIFTSTATGKPSCVVNWAKLEIGSVATEFSPPSIAEELSKCQRYYQRYNFANNMPLPFGIARNEKTVSINVNIPKLRTTPTFATSGTVKLLNQNITGLTLINNQYYDGVYRLFIETSGLSAGTGILIAGDTDGYYAFDAEI